MESLGKQIQFIRCARSHSPSYNPLSRLISRNTKPQIRGMQKRLVMAREDDRSVSMDVIEIILSKLPVKSLLRLKTVSKSWNDIISDHRFIQTHLQLSKNSTAEDLFVGKTFASGWRLKFSLLRLGDRKFHTESELEVPGESILCSCDGIVLVKGFFNRDYLLWNPSCRTKVQIYNPNYFWETCGLCHDPTIQDFKIVFLGSSYCAFYSCKTKCWTRRSEYTGFKCGWMAKESGVSVSGAVYWVQNGRITDPTHNIVYFDSKDDEMKTLPKPEALKKSDKILLISLGDRLCVWFNNVDESIVQIWIKEKGRDQNSWTKLMSIDNYPKPFGSFRPLHFREGRILMHVKGARFLIYRTCEKTFDEFEDEEKYRTLELCLYMDTLLFFQIHRTLPQRKRKSKYSRN